MAQDQNRDGTASRDNASGNQPPRRTHRETVYHAPKSRKNETDRPEHRRAKPPQKAQNKDSRPSRDARHGTRNPRQLVVETLLRIDSGGYSNIVWDLAIKRAELSNLDKMLATRIFYGTLSNMRLIDALWTDIEPEMLTRADAVVRMTLRSAMYQLVFLDRVPAYSIVSTSVDVVKRLRNRAASGYCNALLRKAVARQEAGTLHYTPTGNALEDFAVQYSLNDDLASLLMREFGAEAPVVAESMLAVPRMVLRVNRSKSTMADLLAIPDIQIDPCDRLPQTACAVLARHEAIDDAIERGIVCVQDEAAQLAVTALGAPASWAPEQPQVHIWDACAGLGGKTIHLMDEIACAPTHRKYAILSTDLYANKLERLKDYQQKHFPNQPLLVKARDLTVGGSVPMAPFDVILVDAPCSGLGVLRRHPEVKMTRTAEAIDALVNLQRDILDNVCRHLRPGGILVYAVCTITAEECENQVADFLARHPNFRQDALLGPCFGQTPPSQVKFMPHVDGCDGFFVARFVRET
ncbi:MAG: transcription antitermination factor NusB [Bradymonadia bacterium]